MSYFDPDALESTFDFFILNAFSSGPLSEVELNARISTLRTYLDLIAARKGMRSVPHAVVGKLQQLERDGWLEAQARVAENSPSEVIYSLTANGRERVGRERMRRDAMVSQFVEEADLDASFRRFLDRTGTLGFNR